MTEDGPFELIVVVVEGPGLKVVLTNRTDEPRKYCFSMFWQPPLLVLKGPDGGEIKGQDQRAIMRPLDPIGSDAFHVLGPGENADLQEAWFERPGEGYAIHFGHQSFHGLGPGDYHVTAVMECTRDSWADEKRNWHLEGDVWKGALRSKEAKIKLP